MTSLLAADPQQQDELSRLMAACADQVCDWLAGQQQAMIDCLQALVDTDSNSYDRDGVNAAGALIQSWLEADGIECVWHANEAYGDALEARIGGGQQAPVLLMGHRDTVFPKGTVEQRPFTREGMKAFGPGVADMKSGLVLNCFVLRALHQLQQQGKMAMLPFPALPCTRISKLAPPLRADTTLPLMRPGSALKTARAPSTTRRMVCRPSGEPISSSPVNRATTGNGSIAIFPCCCS